MHESPSRILRSPLAAARAAALALATAVAAAAPAAPVDATGGSARAVVRDLAFPAPAVTASEDGRWSVASLPDGELAGPVGSPEIPSVRVRLRLGPGERVLAAALEVVAQETTWLGRPLRPFAGGRSTAEEHPPVAEPDAAIYGSDALYPPSAAEPVASFELSGGARFGVVRVHPLRVRPRTGELVAARQARLRVTIAGGEGAGLPDGSGPVRYVILTGDDPALASAWQPLADWKTATGDPARVVTTAWVREHYRAIDSSDKRLVMVPRDLPAARSGDH